MESERVLSALIGACVSGAIYITSALIQKGRRDEQFDIIKNSVSELTKATKEIEKQVNERVLMSLFKEEIADIHARISRTQKEQALAMEKLDGKVDSLIKDLHYMSGVMSQIPAKIDELRKGSV